MEPRNIGTLPFSEQPEYITRSDVAVLLHASLSYVDHLDDLPFYRLGKKKLFSKPEVLEYINRNHVNPVARRISKTDAIHMKEEADE